jgi:hypothetical protein
MTPGAMKIEGAAVLVASAVGALKEARRQYPDKGECATRAVIDVEIGNLSASINHLRAIAAAS